MAHDFTPPHEFTNTCKAGEVEVTATQEVPMNAGFMAPMEKFVTRPRTKRDGTDEWDRAHSGLTPLSSRLLKFTAARLVYGSEAVIVTAGVTEHRYKSWDATMLVVSPGTEIC